MRTHILFLFLAAVGLQLAISASVASDQHSQDESDEEDISELQKRDQMEFDMTETEDDQSYEDAAHHEVDRDEFADDEDNETPQGPENMETESEAESDEEVDGMMGKQAEVDPGVAANLDDVTEEDDTEEGD